MAKNNMIWARLDPLEREVFDAIKATEGLNVSSTIRHLIRLGARVYGYLPTIDCQDYYSQQVKQTDDAGGDK